MGLRPGLMGGQTPLPRPFSLGPPPPGSTIPKVFLGFRLGGLRTRTLNPNVNPNPYPNPASTLNPIPKRYDSLQVVLWVVGTLYWGLTNKGDPGDGGPVPAFRASLVPLQK